MSVVKTNADILRGMLQSGKTLEAVRWLGSVEAYLPAEELVQLQAIALNATGKRPRGGGGHIRDEFVDMACQLAFANAVQCLVDGGESIEAAAGEVAKSGVPDPCDLRRRIHKSESSVRAHYREWKSVVKLNESPFD